MAESFEHPNSLAELHKTYSARMADADDALLILGDNYKTFVNNPVGIETLMAMQDGASLYTSKFLAVTEFGLEFQHKLPASEGAYQANLRLFSDLTDQRQQELNRALTRKPSFAGRLGQFICGGGSRGEGNNSSEVRIRYEPIADRYGSHYRKVSADFPDAGTEELIQRTNAVYLAKQLAGEYAVLEGESQSRHQAN